MPAEQARSKRKRSLHDVVVADSCGVHELRRGAGAGEPVHGEKLHVALPADVGEGLQDGGADSSFEPVVLDDDDLAVGRGRGVEESSSVDRLHRVQVDDACVNALSGEVVRGLQRRVDCHPGTEDGDIVVLRGAQRLAPADREVFTRRVEHRIGTGGVRRYTIPSLSSICSTSAAALVASDG